MNIQKDLKKMSNAGKKGAEAGALLRNTMIHGFDTDKLTLWAIEVSSSCGQHPYTALNAIPLLHTGLTIAQRNDIINDCKLKLKAKEKSLPFHFE